MPLKVDTWIVNRAGESRTDGSLIILALLYNTFNRNRELINSPPTTEINHPNAANKRTQDATGLPNTTNYPAKLPFYDERDSLPGSLVGFFNLQSLSPFSSPSQRHRKNSSCNVLARASIEDFSEEACVMLC